MKDQKTPNCTKCKSITRVSSYYEDMWFCPECKHGDYINKTSPEPEPHNLKAGVNLNFICGTAEPLSQKRGKFDKIITHTENDKRLKLARDIKKEKKLAARVFGKDSKEYKRLVEKELDLEENLSLY